MPLIVHHLRVSQSDRVVWPCEELGIDYVLKKYDRLPVLGPPEFKALHPLGAAPVIAEGRVKLAALMRDLAVKSIGCSTNSSESGLQQRFKEKFSAMLAFMDDQLADVSWLAGEEFSLADIMVVCCLTTMRYFKQYDLGDYENT